MDHGQVIMDQRVWLTDVRRARRGLERMRGLLGSPPLQPGQGLWIEACGAVHTFGMRYALDLVFVDAAGNICRLRRNLRPGRMAWGGWRARHVLELPAGTLPEAPFPTGTTLRWQICPQA